MNIFLTPTSKHTRTRGTQTDLSPHFLWFSVRRRARAPLLVLHYTMISIKSYKCNQYRRNYFTERTTYLSGGEPGRLWPPAPPLAPTSAPPRQYQTLPESNLQLTCSRLSVPFYVTSLISGHNTLVPLNSEVKNSSIKLIPRANIISLLIMDNCYLFPAAPRSVCRYVSVSWVWCKDSYTTLKSNYSNLILFIFLILHPGTT